VSRAVAAGVLLVLALTGVTTASAQATGAGSSDGVTFLKRSAFHLTAERLSGDDPRFVWDTNFGGDLDLIDYGVGRLNFAANYQAILGEEFRPFDPTQGNYILVGRLTGRIRAVEVGGEFFHQSRHLSDRAKRQPVDWNMLGTSLETRRQYGRVDLLALANLRGVVQKSYVDYRWEVAGGARVQYAVSGTASILADGRLRWLGTDGTRNRGTQTGARGEGGVRLTGAGAAVELFVAVERRIDPYPLEFGVSTWTTAGFRLLSR
jgi:hypothetical protein